MDPDGDCFQCVAGDVKIYNAEIDLMFENDLSANNIEQLLAAGIYYVVVTDQTTGCIIAHQVIEL